MSPRLANSPVSWYSDAMKHSTEHLPDSSTVGPKNYQVVARRYRPQTFAELVGQSHVSQALSNAMSSGRVGHAYLFTGARGVGKTSSARILAKSLNCVDGPTITPCGVCDSCQRVSTGDDIDVIEIDGASNRGIDEIRQLRQNASICPSRSRFKIYIIDEVHMLTEPAFNALLKTLEEPPPHVKFIFCTTEATKIPITILSRCQRFDFAGIGVAEIASHLAIIAQNEKITAEDGVFETLARRAAGSMRDGQSLLEQLLAFAPEHISLSDVHAMLGTANDQLLFQIVEAMVRCDPTTIFTELDAAASSGVDFGILIEQMIGLLRDMLVVGSGGDSQLLLFCTPPQFETVQQHATAFGIHRILASLQILDQTHNRMRFSTQGRILLELAFVRIAHLDHFQMVADLIDQLKTGQLASTPPTAPVVKPVQRSIAPPQQRPVSNIVDLKTFDDGTATNIWKEVADTVPGRPGQFAANPVSVRFVAPNLFVVTLGLSAKDYCDRETPKFQNAICQKLGQTVRVRFDFIEEKKSVAPASAVLPQDRQTSPLRAAAENPMVQKVEALFGAEFYEIR